MPRSFIASKGVLLYKCWTKICECPVHCAILDECLQFGKRENDGTISLKFIAQGFSSQLLSHGEILGVLIS